MAALKYWLWLTCALAVGSPRLTRLLEEFGSPEAVYEADRDDIAKIINLRKNEAFPLADKSMDRAERILEECERQAIQIMTIQDSRYPDRLRNISFPPCVLYLKGRFPTVDEYPAITVVGTRRPSMYGIRVAKRFSTQLAKSGALIISGMASGIDSAANESALDAGKPTIAVMGCGLDICYPAENRRLFERIVAQGGVAVSEYPPGTPPVGVNFPVRNRIMAGLSLGVLVIEAPFGSGSLITASYALNEGRDVFAVPGNIDTAMSAGTNHLISEGATPALSVWNVLSGYASLYPHRIDIKMAEKPFVNVRAGAVASTGPLRKAAQTPPKYNKSEEDIAPPPEKEAKIPVLPPNLDERQRRLCEILSEGARHVDELVQKSGYPSSEVLGSLTMLEIKGIVRSLPGKWFNLVEK